jgi:peptide/nickel transport system permease protein
MWRRGLRLTGHFALGILGAIILAAFVSEAGGHASGFGSFMAGVFARLYAAAHLDFGVSSVTALPAWTEIVRRLPATLELVGFGAVIAVLVGTPVGILLSAGRILRASAPLIQIVAAAPVFCAGLALLWLSERVLHWSGAPREASLWAAVARGDTAAIEAGLRAVALPALTVGAAGAASVQLALRRTVSRAVDEPYRRGLRAMGLGRFEIDRLYLVPRVMAGLLQSLGEVASSLLAAAAVAEWVFDWPGAADLFLKSVALQDWTVVGLILFVFATLTMAAEFCGLVAARLMAEAEQGP